MSEKNGGPAFPFTGDWEGMTLRDYFAAKAMQALLCAETFLVSDNTAHTAYEIADAMLRAREVKP